MKVILAGYNLDTETIKELGWGKRGLPLTPETISAAYARISRSPKSVDRLRAEARHEIGKARFSNRRIIFEMSHHSIAEHAVFNFDIIGISRLAVEKLEKFRLCSYTEKSQRYVTLKGDFVIPAEIKNTGLTEPYVKTIKLQNSFYSYLLKKIVVLNYKKFPNLAKYRANHRTLENWAKEDARYVLSLATQTQVGATINARNLELMIRRFASNHFEEVRILGKKLYETIRKIAPSIILFYRANDYDQKTNSELFGYAGRQGYGEAEKQGCRDVNLRLVDHTPYGDEKVLAALLFKVANNSHARCLQIVKKMTIKQKLDLFKQACKYMELYDVAPREFEYASLVYSMAVSAGCFGQLKRHRLASIVTQDYDPRLGYTLPESVREVGEETKFNEIIQKTEDIFEKIEKKLPGVGSYILTNAHRKMVLIGVNLRELYHISRLREDPTAQWDIRKIAQQMSACAARVMPVTTGLLGGKTDYPEIYRRHFGSYPKITEVPPIK